MKFNLFSNLYTICTIHFSSNFLFFIKPNNYTFVSKRTIERLFLETLDNIIKINESPREREREREKYSNMNISILK